MPCLHPRSFCGSVKNKINRFWGTLKENYGHGLFFRGVGCLPHIFRWGLGEWGWDGGGGGRNSSFLLNRSSLSRGPSAPVSDTLVGRQTPTSSAAAETLPPRGATAPGPALLPPSSQPATGRWTGSASDLVTTLSSRFLVTAEITSSNFPLIRPAGSRRCPRRLCR